MTQLASLPIDAVKPSEVTSPTLDGTEIVFIIVGGVWRKTTTDQIAARALASQTESIQDMLQAFLLGANGVSLVYDDPGNTLTIKPPVEILEYALSDESTALTGATPKLTVRMPFAFTLLDIRASLTEASTSGAVMVDINEGGSSILSTKLTIDANEKTSTTAAAPAVISDPNLADDAEITFDIDAAGTGAKGLKVKLYGRRT